MIRNTEHVNRMRPWLWVIPIFLVSLIFILDPRYFSSPPLRSDDWNWLVEPQIFDPLKWIVLSDRRPLISFLFAVITPLLGLNISLYYVMNWFLLFATGIIYHEIIKNAFPKTTWLALPAALLFLIYPVNYARTWLILSPITLSLLAALSAILLFVLFAKTGKLLFMVVGNLLFLFSLGIYESSFGIVMLAALTLSIFPKDAPRNRRIGMVVPILMGIGFMAWRVFLQPRFFGVQDEYLTNVSLSIPTILSRYVQGFFIFLFNWVGPLLFIFGDYKYYVFVGILILAALVFAFLLPGIKKSARSNPDYVYSERKQKINTLLKITGLGLVFWAAGYIPVISLYQPIFYGDSSRVNYSAIPGAALALTAGIASLITLIKSNKSNPQRALLYAILPLVILGMVFQVVSQNERNQIWETNKSLWQSMFRLAPNFEDGTIVVVAIPGFTELAPFEMLPFHGDWEIQSALHVLYNNPSLFGEYFYIDLPNHPDNWFPIDDDYSRFVFLYFEPQTSSLSVVEDPKDLFSIPFDVADYSPQLRLKDGFPDTYLYRFLLD